MKELIERGLDKEDEELCRQLSSDDDSVSSRCSVASRKRKRGRRETSSDDQDECSSSSADDDSTVDSDFSAEESEGQLGSSTDSEAEKAARADRGGMSDSAVRDGALSKRNQKLAHKLFSDTSRYMRKQSIIPHDLRFHEALRRHELALSQVAAAPDTLMIPSVKPSKRRNGGKPVDVVEGDTVLYHSSRRVLEKTGFPIVLTFSRRIPAIFSS
jgi:hypothetical protein